MGEAAKISLKAIGKQDTYLLSKDPADSLFRDRSERHSEFRKYHRTRNVIKPGQIPNWPFGQTIKVEFKPRNMGDLLSNMWLSIVMPGLSNGNYADQLGRHLLKTITMFVDDIEVEKIHDDWGIIYDELYLEISEKVANRFLVNRNLPFDSSVEKEDIAAFDSDVVVPLHFFFSRKYANDEHESNQPNRPYFPVCAIHKQKIEIELEFHTPSFFTDTTDTLDVPSFSLVTEEITVTADERNYLVNEKQRLITDLVRKHPTTESELNKDTIRTNLVPNIPVKCLHWFLRNKAFESEGTSVSLKVFNETGDPIVGQEDNRFGDTVAISGDGSVSVVGEPGESNSAFIVFTENELGIRVPTLSSESPAFLVLAANALTVVITRPNFPPDGGVTIYYFDGTWKQLGDTITGATTETSLAISDDGTTFVVATPPNIDIYDVDYTPDEEDWSLTASFTTGEPLFGSSISISGDGSRIAVGTPGFVNVYGKVNGDWDFTTTPPPLQGFQGENALGTSVSLSFTGRFIAIGALTYVRVHDVDDNEQVGETIPSGGSIVSLAGNASRLAIKTPQNKVEVYDFRYGTWPKVGSVPGDIESMAMSKNGRVLIVGSPESKTAKRYDLSVTIKNEFEFHNRFNFSSGSGFDQIQTFFNPLMKDASFFINSTRLQNVTNTNHAYYKYLIPSKYRLARPIRNIYTYSFSMNPVNVEPSGNLDFSQIKSEKTVLEVRIDPSVDIATKTYALHMYYTGYQTFDIDRGVMRVAY